MSAVNTQNIWSKHLEGRDHFEGLDMDRKEVLKLFLEKYCGTACVDWSDELRVPLQAKNFLTS